MRKGIALWALGLPVYISANSNGRELSMKLIERGSFKVHYSGEDPAPAKRVLAITEKTCPVLKELFAAGHDVRLETYWADRRDWPRIPVCRNRGSYGMPHMTRGSNSTHYVILPAVNIDPPDAVVRLFERVLDTQALSEEQSARLRQLLGPKAGENKQTLRAYLFTSDFYVDFFIEIVHIHEVMHDFCFEFGIPENHGRDGRQAWWLFEMLAQWSVLWVQREIGNPEWAEIHARLYRWMYRTGNDQLGNVSPLKYKNYAWFHGALVEMACRLENQFGEDYGPKVLRQVLQKIKGRHYLADADVVEAFSKAAGRDLRAWFKVDWQIE